MYSRTDYRNKLNNHNKRLQKTEGILSFDYNNFTVAARFHQISTYTF